MNGVYMRWVAATVVTLCLLTGSCSKAPPREYEVLNAPSPDSPADMTLNATVIVEVIEVKSSLFEEWIAGNRLVSNSATPLRKSAQGWVHQGDAAIAETITLSVKDGLTSRIQSQQIVFSTKDEYKLKTNMLGSSMEASVTINPDSRVCSVQLNPTVLNSDGNLAHWSGTNLASSMQLPEMTYGFLGSRNAGEAEPDRKRSSGMTSLFFLRADTNLPPLPETPSTSPL